MRAPLSGRSRNFGFVRFGVEAERDQALQQMNGTEIFGRPVRVSLATAKKTQTPPIGQQGPSGQERAGKLCNLLYHARPVHLQYVPIH